MCKLAQLLYFTLVLTEKAQNPILGNRGGCFVIPLGLKRFVHYLLAFFLEKHSAQLCVSVWGVPKA